MGTGELLGSIAEDLLEIQIREELVLRKIAELDRRGAAAELGHKDLVQVFKHCFQWDVRVSRHRIRHARLITSEITLSGAEVGPSLPVTAAALAEGAFSEEHLAVIAEVMEELPAEAEAPLVEFAREHEPRAVKAFAKELAYRLFQNDREPADTELKPPVNRLVRRIEQGRYKGWFDLDLETGAKLDALVDPLAAPHPEGSEGPDVRTLSEREGHALAEVINLAARAERQVSHGGEPVTLAITVNYEDLARQVSQGVLDSRERLPMDRVRKAACDAGLLPILLGGKGEPVDIGRKARSLPAALRRILVVRDRGCVFPGCDRPPRHCEGHHIKHWADGGATDVENCVLLCKRHHDLIHHSEWEVRMDGGVPVFIPPAFLDPERRPRRNQLHAGDSSYWKTVIRRATTSQPHRQREKTEATQPEGLGRS